MRTELVWAAGLEAALAVAEAPPAPDTSRTVLQPSAPTALSTPGAPRTTSWACTAQTQPAQDIIFMWRWHRDVGGKHQAPPSSLNSPSEDSPADQAATLLGHPVQTNSPSVRADFLETKQTYWANPHPALIVLLQKLFCLPFTVTAFGSGPLDNSTAKENEGEKNLPFPSSLSISHLV